MAAFIASDVTVAVVDRKVIGTKHMVVGTMAFGGGPTYPTGGIPLPAIASFGMIRNIDDLNISGLNGLTTDYMTRYDKTNHKLSLFEEEAAAAGGPLLECDTGEAPPARTYNFVAWGW